MQIPHKFEQNNYKDTKRNENWTEKIWQMRKMSVPQDTQEKWI